MRIGLNDGNRTTRVMVVVQINRAATRVRWTAIGAVAVRPLVD